MPFANTHAMYEHLVEISSQVEEGAHAIVIIDGAGWHTTKALRTPDNISILRLPAYSPELNPQENIWQYSRMQRPTVMVRAPASFVNRVLWPEFQKLSDALSAHLLDITNRIIREEVYATTEEAKETRRRAQRVQQRRDAPAAGGQRAEVQRPPRLAGQRVDGAVAQHGLRLDQRAHRRAHVAPYLSK